MVEICGQPVVWSIASRNVLVDPGGYLVNIGCPGVVSLASSGASNGVED